MSTVFNVGDRFRFIRDNSNGGARFGTIGENFEVKGVSHSPSRYGDQITYHRPGVTFDVNVPVKDIELVVPAKTPQSPIKATFEFSRVEIEEAMRDYVSKKLGLRLRHTTGSLTSAEVVTVTAEVIPA
ncbi:hypothetical protein [Ochrobactrum sp. BTU1]|uniref:hypothetical protein n=1 Tax=Ochrobactrum sp. BTU1 TaxID=2840456 RepID=UPI001C04FBCB|nr:hypothetical protein KMS41_05000 [Ochrobactrum sp. BTU1]